MKKHATKNGSGTLQRLADPVQGDGRGEIRNGYPERKPYIPRGLTEDQHARLMALLNRNNDPDGSVYPTTEERGEDA